MSRIRLKSFKMLKYCSSTQHPVNKSQQRLSSACAALTSSVSQQHIKPRIPCQKMRPSLSRGYLSKRETEAIQAKNSSDIIETGEVEKIKGRSRSPSYNQIKKKRLVRDRKSRARLKKAEIAQISTDIPKFKGLEHEQKKIKNYINKLEVLLCNIQEQKQKVTETDRRKSRSKIHQSNQTERKGYKPHNQKDPNKQTVKIALSSRQPEQLVSHNSQLVREIIEKTKKQRKLINLQDVRSQYKEMSPAKDFYASSQTNLSQQNVQIKQIPQQLIQETKNEPHKHRRSIKPYKQVSEAEDKENEINQPIVEEEQEDPSKVDFKSRFDCSQIRPVQKRDSFFSEAPSYLKDQPLRTATCQEHQPNKILNLLALDTIELKKALKCKEKKKLMDIWKKNFPQGFFEGVDIA